MYKRQLWFWGLGRVPAGQAAFLPQLSPVVAGVLGWVVLGDEVTVWQLLGFVLALAAIVASQTHPPGRRPAEVAGPSAAGPGAPARPRAGGR